MSCPPHIPYTPAVCVEADAWSEQGNRNQAGCPVNVLGDAHAFARLMLVHISKLMFYSIRLSYSRSINGGCSVSEGEQKGNGGVKD